MKPPAHYQKNVGRGLCGQEGFTTLIRRDVVCPKCIEILKKAKPGETPNG